MKTFTYVIKDKEGIHARPAGLVVTEAKKYVSNMTISAKGKTADLKRIFSVMGLCAKCGDEVTITANGADEDKAIEAVKEVFTSHL